jgi:TonB family protein
MRVDIDRGDDLKNISSFQKAFQNIFLSDIKLLADLVPSYWKQFAFREFGGLNKPEYPLSSLRPIGIVLPRVLSKPPPYYTRIARQARVEGKLLLEVIVDIEGSVTVQNIINPLGMGLEESALETLSEWKFEPASLNGKPVACPARIEIHFRLY